MKARINPAQGRPFHLWWKDRVVTDDASELAGRTVAYLNGEIDLPTSRANPNGTDSHWLERGRLLTEDDFLLTVGSLVDRLDGVLAVELVEIKTN
jgi:hypothetical protein